MGQVSGGRFNRIDVGGVINIPIVEDKLKSSIAFSSKNRNDWQKRIPFPGAAGFASDPSEAFRSEEHTSELQSLMRNSYAVFCLKKQKIATERTTVTSNKHIT